MRFQGQSWFVESITVRSVSLSEMRREGNELFYWDELLKLAITKMVLSGESYAGSFIALIVHSL